MSDTSDHGTARGSPRFVVERYVPGLTAAMASASERQVRRACRALAREGRSVRYVGSIVISAEETALLIFQAQDAASVAEAHRRAGLPFDRVVPALELRRGAPQPKAGAAGVGEARQETRRHLSARRFP